MNRSHDLELTLFRLSKKISLSIYNMIIVDNGSSIEHKEKNESLAQKYNSKYYYLSKNLGVSGGRNFALQKCNTKFVIEIDDDVEFLVDNFIETILDHFYPPLVFLCLLRSSSGFFRENCTLCPPVY